MTEFEDSFLKYKKNMYSVVRKMGLSHEKAEDAVQDAAEKLSQMATISYVEPNKVKGLFCAQAKNSAIDMNRIEKRQKRDESEEVPIRIGKKERQMMATVVVHRALARLPTLEGYVAWKYFGLEQSLREISEDLLVEQGLKMDHSKIRRVLSMARKKLKAILVELGGDKV